MEYIVDIKTIFKPIYIDKSEGRKRDLMDLVLLLTVCLKHSPDFSWGLIYKSI